MPQSERLGGQLGRTIVEQGTWNSKLLQFVRIASIIFFMCSDYYLTHDLNGRYLADFIPACHRPPTCVRRVSRREFELNALVSSKC